MINVPVTVAMPCIPPRGVQPGPDSGIPLPYAVPGIRYVPGGSLFAQAHASVVDQTAIVQGGLAIALDVNHEGAAATRQRALNSVTTEFVAFLDDDDLYYPWYLEIAYGLAVDHGADYVYTWFDGNDPFPMHRGRQMNPADPHHTTMTILVKTELAKEVGFVNHPDANPDWPGEDWRFIGKCIEAGATFIGTDQICWHYRVHSGPGGNTSGLPNRWSDPK
jgi:hypothetical protein